MLMNAREYYLQVQNAVQDSPLVLSSDIHFEEIDVNECYVRGVVTLISNLELHIAEYTCTLPTLVHIKYRYHLQTSSGELVARWDNAPHHTTVSTFPHHQHSREGKVYDSLPMDLTSVLDACVQFI